MPPPCSGIFLKQTFDFARPAQMPTYSHRIKTKLFTMMASDPPTCPWLPGPGVLIASWAHPTGLLSSLRHTIVPTPVLLLSFDLESPFSFHCLSNPSHP